MFTDLLRAENWRRKLKAAKFRVDPEPWERKVYPIEPPAVPILEPRAKSAKHEGTS